MNETAIVDAVTSCVDARIPLEVAGTGTLLSRLPEPPPCHRLELAGYNGVTDYQPDDLVVTARAGTRIEELDAVLGEHGQECPIDGPGVTVGGRVASGLSGIRRPAAGPVRDWLLGARIVTAMGHCVHVGGRTVKNVTGYDLPRLLCGSWGTLAVLCEVTLRVRPRPFFRRWYATEAGPAELHAQLGTFAACLRTRTHTYVLLEGHREDCIEQAQRAGLDEADPPVIPDGVRVAVPPSAVEAMLARIGGDYVAEIGVGIIHADPPAGELASLRVASIAAGGRLLVLRRGTGTSAFGGAGSDPFHARIKRAFDPDAVFAPWRFAA